MSNSDYPAGNNQTAHDTVVWFTTGHNIISVFQCARETIEELGSFLSRNKPYYYTDRNGEVGIVWE